MEKTEAEKPQSTEEWIRFALDQRIKETGLSNNEIGRRIGCTGQMVYYLREGRSQWTSRWIAKLCDEVLAMTPVEALNVNSGNGVTTLKTAIREKFNRVLAQADELEIQLLDMFLSQTLRAKHTK